MKVRMRGTISGTRNGAPWPGRDEVVDLPDVEAAALCALGMAEPVVEVPETATVKGEERRRKRTSGE